jgi:hypothetical protein
MGSHRQQINCRTDHPSRKIEPQKGTEATRESASPSIRLWLVLTEVPFPPALRERMARKRRISAGTCRTVGLSPHPDPSGHLLPKAALHIKPLLHKKVEVCTKTMAGALCLWCFWWRSLFDDHSERNKFSRPYNFIDQTEPISINGTEFILALL